MRPGLPTVLAAVLTFLGGGLAGAVFTWYVNRPQPTTVTYRIATTTIGADPEARSVVPNLKIQVGKTEIAVLYVHDIEFSVPRGPHVDSGEVAITFPPSLFPGSVTSTRLFGTLSESPSPVHRIQCTPLDNGSRCVMGPLSPANLGIFRVRVATNHPDAPRVVMVIKNVEFIKAEEFLSRESRSKKNLMELLLMMSTVAAVASAVLGERVWRQWRLSRKLPPSGISS